MLAILISNIYIVTLLASPFFSSHHVLAVDPVDELTRGIVYTAKDTVEKFLRQIGIPEISKLANGGVSIKIHPTVNKCPLCQIVSPQVVVGLWQIVLYSRGFLLNVLTDTNQLIDRLQKGMPISTEKSIYDMVLDPPTILCPNLTILNASEYSKFELAYQMDNGQSKSIVGGWDRTVDGTYFWQIGPTISLEVCISYAGKNIMPANFLNGLPEFLVLNQIDSFPRCDNFIALVRSNSNSSFTNELRDFLEQQKVESVFNKLEKAPC